METKIINQHEAIKYLEAGEDISAYKVVFNKEKTDVDKLLTRLMKNFYETIIF